MSLDKLKSLISEAFNSFGTQNEKNAINNASSYIDNLDSDLSKLAAQNDIDIFSSGDNFKKYITSKTGFDESIFTNSIDKLMNMDLSGLTVEKEAKNEDSQDYGFYSMLNEIYSNETIKDFLDADSDGEISDEEAKKAISNFKGMDSNSEDFSLDDIAYVVDEVAKANEEEKSFFEKMSENMKNAFEKAQDNIIEQMDNANNQGAMNLPTGGGIASNPYTTGSSNSSNTTSNTTQTQDTTVTKEELQTKIDDYKEEISQINSEEQEAVKEAAQERDTAKEEMEAQLEKDEKVDKETKEEFTKVTNEIAKKESEISECETEIAQTESELTQGENKLSTLKDALSSLEKPQGDDTQALEKYEERKSELEKQIAEQEKANEELEEKLSGDDGLEKKKEALEKELNDPKEGLLAKKQELTDKIQKTCSDETKEAIENYENKKSAVEDVKAQELSRVQEELNKAQEELKTLEEDEEQKANKSATNSFDADFDEMLGQVLGYEGGFSDHPLDNGGATNYGITEATYRAYTGDPNADVRNITKEEAAQIYYTNYYQASGAEEYAKNGDSAYAFAVFDAAVNHGVGAAQKMDSQAGGDVDKFMEIRKQKYISIVANNPSQAVFEEGWQNRWNNVYAFIDPSHQYENYIG